MRAILEIDQKDFGPYIKSGGIAVTPVVRSAKTVTTLNGTLHKFFVKKWSMKVTLLDMSDSDFQELSAKLQNSPCYVKYADFEKGLQITGKFHISDLGYTISKTIGNITYLTEISFKLEEV